MSEKRRKTFVFVLLIGSVIWAYFTFTGQKPDSERRNTPRRSAVRPAPAAPVLVLSEQTAAEYEKRAWGKDPFYHAYRSLPRLAAPKQVKLRLLGILYREIDAQALINTRVVREGDTLAGFRIEQIERDHVKISDGGKSIILRVEKERS